MTTVRPRFALLLAVALTLAACADASSLEPAMKAVEKIRGRKFLHEVRHTAIDRSELTKHLMDQMVKGTPYSLDDWGTVLRALQLVDTPPKEVLPQLLGLYESQVLAFYDPYSHTYYSIKQLPKMSGEMAGMVDPEMLEETVMVHELVHALQDQHFALDKREKANMRDTDANLAYHAVLEGEGVLVMLVHMLDKMGVEFDEVVKDEKMMEMVLASANADSMIDPSTPKYFAQMLKFPYLDGLNLVLAAYKRGGWKEVDKLHTDPPKSTREVLHPEEYFAKTFKPEPFEQTRPTGDVIAIEHLGEFHWRFLVGEANARGWVNDRVSVSRGGKVRAETKWESPERATAFAAAYTKFLTGRGLEPKVAREGNAVTVEYTAK